MDKHFSVAIDGPSGAGKSTIARAAAARFGFIYVDTGAIYRTVGLAAARAGLPLGAEQDVLRLLPELDIRFGYGEDGAAQQVPDDVKNAVEELSKKIVSGEITVETTR